MSSAATLQTPPESAESSEGKGKKAKRRSHPKTRTGCGTCKIRRVKCDEERPSCRRCRKYGIECNGYTTLVKFNPQLVQHSQLRPLVTKQHSKGRLEPKQCFRTRLEPLSGLHSGPRLTDQLEGRYFKYYCNERGARVPANCRSPTIWEKIIPQAGESEEFIGHAVAALGALSVSEDLRRDALHPIQSVARSSSGSKPDSHYQYALTQYCKSLKMMQEGLQGRLWGRSRTTLIANLVIYCIESLMGNADSASIHAARSVNLISQWWLQHLKSGKALCASDAFEEDLYPAFPGLDLQGLLHLDIRTKEVHLEFTRFIDEALPETPKTLETLDSCIIAGQLLLRRNLHFIAGWRMDTHPDIHTLLENHLPHSNTTWSVALGYIRIPTSQRMAQKCYLTELDNYKLKLDAFLQTSIITDNTAALYVNTCRIHVAMDTILLTGACFPPRTSWDSLLPEFEEIVTLCERFYPQVSARGGSTYKFDIGLIVPLAVVAVRCRDIALKRRAIDLLLSKPGYREGIWDAEAMGHICEWFLEREEEAAILNKLEDAVDCKEREGRLVQDKTAAKDKVPTLLMILFELNQRRARIVYAMPEQGMAEMVLKEDVISWQWETTPCGARDLT